MKQTVSIIMVMAVFLLLPATVRGDGESPYGHISLVEGDAHVVRPDKSRQDAVVNLPVAPGDHVVTGKKGRCEMQFDNGTIIRLDRDSRLQVTTVLAPSLTTKWKISTIQLMRGQMFSMNQSYGKQMFQVITPNVAVDFKTRATATIQLADNGDTLIFSKRGKFKAMYGSDKFTIKTEKISGKVAYAFTTDHRMVSTDKKPDIDFTLWNDHVNRNFKKLHFGVSKVPKKIYRYNKALVHWAEKWSSLYGEWIYDDLFGYVWKPADEMFAYSERPFFDAGLVRMSNQLFIVPQQPWGWTPAHMGTWVWFKKLGWTWIPGKAFSPGIGYDPFRGISVLNQTSGFAGWYANSLGYWVRSFYGGHDLYYLYRDQGVSAWRDAYKKRFNVAKKTPLNKRAPEFIRKVFTRINKAPLRQVKERLGDRQPIPMFKKETLRTFLRGARPEVSGSTPSVNTPPVTIKDKITPGKSVTIKPSSVGINNNPAGIVGTVRVDGVTLSDIKPGDPRGMEGVRGGGGIGGGHLRLGGAHLDWNPDKKWAGKRNVTIRYSSRNNAVECPKLKLSSHRLSLSQRMALRKERRSRSGHGASGYGSGNNSSSNNGSSSSAGKSSTGSGSRSAGGGSRHGSVGGGATGSKK